MDTMEIRAWWMTSDVPYVIKAALNVPMLPLIAVKSV